MHLAERPRERDRDAQEMRYLQWPAKQSIERRTAGILEHQRHAAVVVRQRDRPRRPVRVKFSLERIFVFKPLDAIDRRLFSGGKQDRGQAVAVAADRERCLPPSAGRMRSPRARSSRVSSQEELFQTLIRLRLLLPVNPKYVPKNAIGALVARREPCGSLAYGAEMLWHALRKPTPGPRHLFFVRICPDARCTLGFRQHAAL